MKDILTLIRPRLLSIKNAGKADTRNSRRMRMIVLGSLGIAFWAGIFGVSLRVLLYFKGIEALGDILSQKLLSMTLITVFSLLIFSSILTTLSKLYLSRDLTLVHALPVSSWKIYTTRWLESTADSAWMVAVYTIPVFLAYGIVYRTGPWFYVTAVAQLMMLALTASALSAMLVVAVARIIPAGHVRSLFLFFGLTLFIILFIAFRMLRPERLVDPAVFSSTLLYLKSLKTPSSSLLPTTWAFDAFRDSMQGHHLAGLFHLGVLTCCAGTMTCLSIILADAWYFKGLSRSDTRRRLNRRVRSTSKKYKNSKTFFTGPIWAFIVKEIKTFFRDQTQWTQLFLLCGLVIIYLYNFSVLPLDKAPIKTVYLQNLFAFLNMGLAAFVLTAVTARFAFPAVSQEGPAFWLVNVTPISKAAYLWIKFLVYCLPMLILGQLLVISSNILLNVSPFMMGLSIITVMLMTPTVAALGVGLGAVYPDFKSENPAQTVTSFGGFLFMALSGAYIAVVILLEAGPVYRFIMAGLKGESISSLEWIWFAGAFAGILLLSFVTFWVPMRNGIQKLACA